MNTTPNINLSTYTSDPNDKFNLLVTFNGNMNKIDEAVGSQNDAIDVIEETAGTAVTTANTANATASEALTTAEGKTSINDNVASATTTYSSNKIDELISGAGGAVIDDTETSTTKTWSSSKINTETINNRKIIEYLFSDNIESAPVVNSLQNAVDLSAYDNNPLSYTVTEDSILIGELGISATGASTENMAYGEFHPAFTNNYRGNLQFYCSHATGEFILNTKPTIIKAGTTVTLYTNARNTNLFQRVTTCKIRLITISSILNS